VKLNLGNDPVHERMLKYFKNMGAPYETQHDIFDAFAAFICNECDGATYAIEGKRVMGKILRQAVKRKNAIQYTVDEMAFEKLFISHLEKPAVDAHFHKRFIYMAALRKFLKDYDPSYVSNVFLFAVNDDFWKEHIVSKNMIWFFEKFSTIAKQREKVVPKKKTAYELENGMIVENPSIDDVVVRKVEV
jgi:hypothetical protein